MTQDGAAGADARRILLDRYLRGELPKASTTADAAAQSLAARAKSPQKAEARAPIVTIRSGGGKVPFFFPHVHWQGGAAYCFTLADDLGPDQPFYVVEPYRIDEYETLPTLEQIAAECVKSVRSVQPHGPYRLGGYCGAGFILFEMAQQLHAAGERVETLIMIEPGVGPYFAPLLGWVGRGLRAGGARLGISPVLQLALFLHLRHWYKLARYPAYRRDHGLSLVPGSATLRQDWLALFVWIVSAYVPQPYPGKVTYLWARNGRGSQRTWWCRTFVAQEVQAHYVSGNRSNCRSNHVHDLAAQLRTTLNP